MRVQGFLRVYFQAQPILIELEYYSEIQSSLSWDNRWWFSSPSESQLLRNRWHPLSLVQWLSSSSPVCRDSLLLSLLPAALLCSLMAQRASCLLLTALILCLFHSAVCLSVSVSQSCSQRNCTWFIRSATLQPKVSQMVRDLMPVTSQATGYHGPEEDCLAAHCVLIQATVQDRCLTKSGHGDRCLRNKLESLFSQGTGLITFRYPFQKSLSEKKRRQNNNLLLDPDHVKPLQFSDSFIIWPQVFLLLHRSVHWNIKVIALNPTLCFLTSHSSFLFSLSIF